MTQKFLATPLHYLGIRKMYGIAHNKSQVRAQDRMIAPKHEFSG
jgi:hypothetical protein